MNPPEAPLRAGILAAGRGERLRRANAGLKPLVKVGGQTLIERVLRSMAEAGATEVSVIINEDSEMVRDHVTLREWPFALRWIVKTTPSSMHSFLMLVEALASDGSPGPFLLSTVDTVAAPYAYARFINEARRLEAASMVLALTDPGDDEKPLLVRLAPGDSHITALGQAAIPSQFATAGIYAVHPSILAEAESARRDGLGALRQFLSRLLERGYQLAGIPISQSIDVDHPADVESAEVFIRAS